MPQGEKPHRKASTATFETRMSAIRMVLRSAFLSTIGTVDAKADATYDGRTGFGRAEAQRQRLPSREPPCIRPTG